MAIKRTDREEEEFQEILEALKEDYEELMADMADPDPEGGFFACWTDQNGKTVHIRGSDGDRGSISFAEFTEIKNRIGQACLVCAGLLGVFFNSKSRPVLYLSCNRCKKKHKVVLGELCLTDD